MAHKLLNLKGGNRATYRRGVWSYKPGKLFYTDERVMAALQLTQAQLRDYLFEYRITLPWPDEPTRSHAMALAGKRKLKPLQILKVRNQTLRRDLMNAYGIEPLLADGGGTMIQQDDFGKLWEVKVPDGNDKTMKWVEVVNTTPEPDGSHAVYFLRVPPSTRTAQQGVVWTGGITNLSTFGGFRAES